MPSKRHHNISSSFPFAMNRITKSVNTARTLRASIEFCLGAFRSNVEIATFSETNQQFCFCCGIIEKHKSINDAGRNPTFHLLFSGGPARFIRGHLKNYARQILGQTFDISLPAIVFNEVPFHIVKRSDMQSLPMVLDYQRLQGHNVLSVLPSTSL